MKYEVIAQQTEEFSVSRQCEVLGVSESGYYAWRKRPASRRAWENEVLKEQIEMIWESSYGIYGAPRIHAELQARGICVGHNRVARLMREAGIQGKMPRKKRPRTTQVDASCSVSPNILAQRFHANRPNEVWLSDITYIDTHQGYLYLAAVMDLYSRQIVGMAMADHLQTELVDAALDMALQHRHPQATLLHHSDRGSQYTSYAYQQRLNDAGITPSMSRTANCLDNAPIESFWATLKREWVDGVFDTHDQARADIFAYIIGFYNRQRRHSALGYLSPVQFELQRDNFTLH